MWRLLSKTSLKWPALFGAGMFTVAIFAVGVHAQDETPVFRTELREVTLHVTVVDKNGKLVTGIPRSAFKIYEDNVEQPIKLFHPEDVPVSLGILVDNSGSMNDKRSRVAA